MLELDFCRLSEVADNFTNLAPFVGAHLRRRRDTNPSVMMTATTVMTRRRNTRRRRRSIVTRNTTMMRIRLRSAAPSDFCCVTVVLTLG
jgi:hypothetical protein